MPVNPASATTYDVVIYGGTIAGIFAAFTAAQMGCQVVLLEPTNWLGGMMGAGGLVSHDVSTRDFGGLSWHLWKAMAAGEGQDPISQGLVSNIPTNQWPGAFNRTTVSSNIANAGYQDLSSLPGQLTPQPRTAYAALNAVANGTLFGLPTLPGTITVVKNAALQSFGGPVYKSVTFNSTGPSYPIVSLVTNQGTFTGTVFVDASYEGDVMAGVANQTGGTSYSVGREKPSGSLEVGLAGFQPDAGTASYHGFTGSHYPLLDNVPTPLPPNGTPDNNIQTMNYRATLQLLSNGGVAFTKPPGYNTGLFQQFQAIAIASSWTTLSNAFTLQAICGNKYCYNDGADIFTMVNQGAGYPDGTPTQRAAIVAAHKLWYQGSLYFAANDLVGNSTFVANAATYGLSGTDFTDNGHWPYQIYVREGRRMTGAMYVQRYSDCPNNSTVSAVNHSICKGTYVEDCHACSAFTNPTTPTTYYVEGKVASNVNYGKSVQVPGETLVPAPGGCPNLIVPVCHGVSHLAWTCLRTEFLFGMMGEAAGFMAAQVAKFGDINVQNINWAAVQANLTANGSKF